MTRPGASLPWLMATGFLWLVAAALTAHTGAVDETTAAVAALVVLAALAAAVLMAALDPSVTISVGLALSIFSGQFGHLGSPVGIDRIVLVGGILVTLARGVQARVPAEFDVVKYPPERPVTADGVRYIGPVASVEEWYERAHVAVVPVFEGSGTRLKIVEAMAKGRPVVSTRLGAEGLPIQAPKHYHQADDSEGFAAAILTLPKVVAPATGLFAA